MSELILLCEGAAPDRDPVAGRDAFDDAADAVRATPAGRWLQACLGAGRVECDSGGDPSRARESPADAWLRERMRVPASDTPQAYRAWAGESDAPSPRWSLRPSSVQVGHDHLRLLDPDRIGLAPQQSQALAASAAPLFAQAGYQLHESGPGLWFFTAPTQPALSTSASTMACGRSIAAYMPEGADARAWRRLLTEVQMHWHEHPVNADREQSGLPAVNMLWLDGMASGALPPTVRRVAAVDPAIAGLARAAGAQRVDPPAVALPARRAGSGSRAAAPDDEPGDLLIDVALWREARRSADTGAWVQAWQALDGWLDAFCGPDDARTAFRSVRVVLTGERRTVEIVSQRGGWSRLWRRFDPLAAVFGSERR